MPEISPYLGIPLVFLFATLCFIVMKRRGILLGRFKHSTEVQFGGVGPTGSHPQEPPARQVSRSTIQFLPSAREDCANLDIDPERVSDFVLKEAVNHPIIFASPFAASIPFPFGDNVVILSWNEAALIIERVLDRRQAYPLNDIWTSCLATYRQATLLPYRTKTPDVLIGSSEARRSLVVYNNLTSQIEEFVRALVQQGHEAPELHKHLRPLVEEAEFALANGDVAIATARMELALSTTHKFILRFAPGAPATKIANQAPPAIPPVREKTTLLNEAHPTVLVVDDCTHFLVSMKELFQDAGFSVVTAESTADAMRELVEREYDLVVTDLYMACEIDGREVALAAKKASSKTKVVVLTGYPNLAVVADLFKAGIDDVCGKGEIRFEVLIQRIRNMLRLAAQNSGGAAV